jgi:hypothetical protein
MFGLAMSSSENQATRMASGTFACDALMRNCAALSTISRCRVVFLDMLGGGGNNVVEAIAEGQRQSGVFVDRECHPMCVFV